MNKRYLKLKEYVQKHDKIADLGIGKGYYYYKSTCKDVTGVDLSERNLRKLASHSPHIKTYLRDVRDTKLPDKTYDLVVISQVLEHLEDYEPVLAEAKRICKEDGWFLIGTPTIQHHKYHYHPVWTLNNIINVSKRLGELRELIKEDTYWTLYVKNI